MMLDHSGTRAVRRAGTRAAILEAAWELVGRDGLAGLSLREIAAKVTMRAPSLYTYFPSKNELYDAMYADALEQFGREMDRSPSGRTPEETLRKRAKQFVNICVQNPFRFELIFQRPIPGFVPSAEAMAVGLASLAETRRIAAAAGLTDDRAFDLFLAVTRGLAATQIAIEPGGERWVRLVDEAVDLLLANYAPGGHRRAQRTTRPQRT